MNIEFDNSKIIHDESLNSIVPDNPNKPYDMKEIISKLVDDDFFEVHENFAENILTGFAELVELLLE